MNHWSWTFKIWCGNRSYPCLQIIYEILFTSLWSQTWQWCETL